MIKIFFGEKLSFKHKNLIVRPFLVQKTSKCLFFTKIEKFRLILTPGLNAELNVKILGKAELNAELNKYLSWTLNWRLNDQKHWTTHTLPAAIFTYINWLTYQVQISVPARKSRENLHLQNFKKIYKHSGTS